MYTRGHAGVRSSLLLLLGLSIAALSACAPVSIEEAIVVPSGSSGCEAACAALVGRETLIGHVLETKQCIDGHGLDAVGRATAVAVCRVSVARGEGEQYGDDGDLDGDGVRNADDRCPIDAEDDDAVEDDDGCPEGP